jgi:hypothetical protein
VRLMAMSEALENWFRAVEVRGDLARGLARTRTIDV